MHEFLNDHTEVLIKKKKKKSILLIMLWRELL